MVAGATLLWLILRASGATANGVKFVQRTYDRETILAARWAADGKTILYTSSPQAGAAPSMRIIRAEYPEPQPFAMDSAALLAVSSSNEVALLIHARPSFQRVFAGTLARMSIGGGAPREIAENVQEADWSPDGSQLAVTRNAGEHDQLEYPIGTVIYSSPAGAYLSDPRVSADGKRVAFFLHPLRYDDRGFVAFVDAKGTLTKGDEEFGGLEGMAWASDGRSLLFSAAQGSPYVVRRWTPGRRSTEAVLPNAGRLTIFDVRRGQWLVSRDETPQLVVAKAPGARGVRDISWLDGSISPSISADGEMVAFTDQGILSGVLYSVMVRKTDGSPAVRLGEGNARMISPDKRWVLADVPTSPRQFRLYPTGAGAFRTIAWPKLENILAAGFLRDSKSLYVCGNEPKHGRRCYRSGLEGGDVTPVSPESLPGFPRPDLSAVAASSDGKWYVYPSDGGLRREIPGLTQGPIRWSPDGSVLWVFRDGPAGHRGVDRVDPVTAAGRSIRHRGNAGDGHAGHRVTQRGRRRPFVRVLHGHVRLTPIFGRGRALTHSFVDERDVSVQDVRYRGGVGRLERSHEISSFANEDPATKRIAPHFVPSADHHGLRVDHRDIAFAHIHDVEL